MTTARTRALTAPLVLLLALAAGGCGYIEPETLAAAARLPDPSAPPRVAPPRAGSLAGLLRGPAAGLITRHAAGLVGNHAAGVVSGNTGSVVSGNTGSLVQGNTANFALLAAGVPEPPAHAAPVAGAAVALYDALGEQVAGGITSDAEGRFRFEGVSGAGRVLFVRARYTAERHAVELAATVAAPLAGETLAIAVDPASSLVAKKMTTLLAADQIAPAALDPAALEALARSLGGLLDARGVVAAAILPAEQVAEAFDRLAAAHEGLRLTLRKAVEPPQAPPDAGSAAPAAQGGLVDTVAGSGAPGFADGAGPAARFAYPQGLALDDAGNLYVADYNNHSIRRLDPAGVVATIAGNGTAGFADGPGGAARLRNPVGLAWWQGALYVTDAGNRAVRRLVAAEDGWRVETVAGGPDVAAQDGFVAPRGLALDPEATPTTLYVADAGGFRVRKAVLGGAVSTVLELAGSASGQLAGPQALALDGRGALYVADATSNAIRRFGRAAFEAGGAGIESATFAGGGFVGLRDGAGLAARFAYPAALAFDAAGALLVADQLNHAVRRVAATGEVATLAGCGEAGEADGVGAAARFFRPSGLAVARDGTIFVADTDNHRIRRIRP